MDELGFGVQGGEEIPFEALVGAIIFYAGLFLLCLASLIRFFGRPEEWRGVPIARVTWTPIEAITITFIFFAGQIVAATVASSVQASIAGACLVPVLGGGGAAAEWVIAFARQAPLDPVLIQLLLPAVDVAVVIAAILVIRGSGRACLDALGVSRPLPWRRLGRLVLVGLALFVTVTAVGALWAYVLQRLGLDARVQEPLIDFRDALATGDSPAVTLLVFTAVVHAPLIEEFLFRGLLYSSLRRALRPGAAAIVTSVFFTLVHVNLAASVPIFLLSLALCAVRERDGSTFDAIALHAIFNSASLIAVALGAGAGPAGGA